MAKEPNVEETLPKISTGWVGCTNVTDRQTTDGPAIAYSEREREREFTKNKLWPLIQAKYAQLNAVQDPDDVGDDMTTMCDTGEQRIAVDCHNQNTGK